MSPPAYAQIDVEIPDAWIDAVDAGEVFQAVQQWATVTLRHSDYGPCWFIRPRDVRKRGPGLILDPNKVAQAYVEGCKRWGLGWYGDPRTDAIRYSTAIQLALFGEERYS